MRAGPTSSAVNTGFPRFFTFSGYSISAYKFFLCVGIYVGTLTTAALANSSGLPPLRIGLAAMTCALMGLIGARVYHLLVHAPVYFRKRSLRTLWDTSAGGWGVFGALLRLSRSQEPGPPMWLLMIWPVIVGLIWSWQAMLAALAMSAVIGLSLAFYIQHRISLIDRL